MRRALPWLSLALALGGTSALAESSEDTDIQQLAPALEAGPLGIRQPAAPAEPLQVEQPPAASVDRCSEPGPKPASLACSPDEVTVDPAVAQGTKPDVSVRDDGVYLRLDPRNAEDNTFDPDRIARQLDTDVVPEPDDWGAGGAILLDGGLVPAEAVDMPATAEPKVLSGDGPVDIE